MDDSYVGKFINPLGVCVFVVRPMLASSIECEVDWLLIYVLIFGLLGLSILSKLCSEILMEKPSIRLVEV